MAFTNHSGLFAAVDENAINTTIGHLMRQRPSLFNYATLIFTQALSSQFCMPIAPPPGGGPLFTVEPQLPVLGAPQPLGLDWCLQLSNVSIDLYPGHTLPLPPELDPIVASSSPCTCGPASGWPARATKRSRTWRPRWKPRWRRACSGSRCPPRTTS